MLCAEADRKRTGRGYLQMQVMSISWFNLLFGPLFETPLDLSRTGEETDSLTTVYTIVMIFW